MVVEVYDCTYVFVLLEREFWEAYFKGVEKWVE